MIEQEEYSGNTGPGTPGNLEKMTQGERAALIILDCVKRLKSKVGRKKLAQVLHGSTVPDMHRFHYDKNVYYARLAAVKQSDIERLIIQLIDQSYLKAVGGEYPVLTLSPLGENALEQKSAIALDLPESFLPKNLKRSQAKRAAGGSLAYTAQLISNGLTPEQIAEERGLAPWTIYGHLAQLIERGEVEVERVVPGEVRWHIEQAIQQVGSTELLSPIKALLPEKITYSQIRCVVSAFRATEGSKPAPINPQPVVPQSDVVELYLGKPHPRPLTGPWQCGWALGFHSRFSGGDWSRSGVGDLAYRLKYESDLSTLPALVEQAQAVMAAHPELAQVDAILPVPPSTPRPTEPVQAFCAALSVKIQIPVKALAVKTRQTQPQKELKTLAQKRTNVSGAFTLSGSVAGKRILIVDDLYDSGATLNELTRLLLKNGAACVHVLTLTRTIHSDL